MSGRRYWVRLAVTFVLMVAFGFLCLAVAGLRIGKEVFRFGLVLLPGVIAPVVFAVVLARSPWLRHSTALRSLMIIGGTLALWALYVVIHFIYGQAVIMLVIPWKGHPALHP